MRNRSPEKIKEQITLGTRRLVAAGGMSNFSFPKLSAETGIAAPTVYEHYKNKEDLLTSCYLAIDAEIGALLSAFLQNDPPHRHEPEKIDVYCRALWAAYWRYLTADADRTLFYWSFYHSEYYTQAVAARSIPNYRTLEAFMDALDERFHISERHDSSVLVANMIDGSVSAAVRVLRGEFSGDDRTLNTIYQTVIQPLFSVLGLRI